MSSADACPVSPQAAAEMMKAGCPIDHSSGKKKVEEPRVVNASDCGAPAEAVNTNNQMLIQEKQTPSKDQRIPLSTSRVHSSIPKGEVNPAHQDPASQTWQYPSPQMFYNAMRRKGWEPQERDMGLVVSIHNTVNEQTWRQVLEWERLHTDETPKLKRFVGRAKDFSPKARLKSLFGYALPFDRHDWIVERNGKDVRYVIDFYSGQPTEGKLVGIHIDARPALDSVESAVDRVKMAWIKFSQGSKAE